MTKINEILRIKEDVIFGGAIQADWYYDKRGLEAAKNFVFHGPDYFGVLEDEISFTSHKLIDTCSFTENIARKLVTSEGNPISLAIAGYGTGKSHLAVTLANLFSNPLSTSSNKIFSNIKIASYPISQYIKNSINKPNFCIVLNGMKDFNLNYEIINNVKKTLKENGYDDEFLAEFTKAYSIASTFVERNFDRFEKEFINLALKREIETKNLKGYLLDNIYKDEVFDLINELYREITGEYIRWDEGVTAAEVINKLSEKLCGDNQPFNKVLIFFDEFGRYLEYVSAYPTRAGDAALQQIYDVVTGSENNILLVGFIQSDLKTYLARVSKSSNVSRYIGRYESGEKLYLSSNIETIFANIIEKYNASAFNYYVKEHFGKGENVILYTKLFQNLNKWTINNKTRGLWNDAEKFKKVILEGIYPFHPLTTYLLTALSEWYQQRSALQFLVKSFNYVGDKEIKELGDLPQVYPIDLLKGELFKELILAEEEGRQKSEYCTVYEKIISKYEEKLNLYGKDVLTAILALKLLKFKISDKDNLFFLLENLTGYSSNLIITTINELESEIGIISYDEKNYTFDFIEDATGINDFNRFIKKKKQEITIPLNVMINESILEKIGISQNIKPDFSMKNNIKTSEWQFEQQLVPVDNITSNYIENLIKEYKLKTSVDKPKGKLLYIYYNSDYGIEYIDKLSQLYKKLKLENYPIILVLIDDKDHEFEESIIANTIINKFTQEEQIKFSKFIGKYSVENEERLRDVFRELSKEKQIVQKNNLVRLESRMSLYCNEILNSLYSNIIPFPFDGFDGKTITNPKKNFLNICTWLLSGSSVNEQGYHLLTKEVKNRAEALLINESTGWGTISKKFEFIYPKNNKVKSLYNDLNDGFKGKDEISIGAYYDKYIDSPYGLNDYSFTLLIISYLLYQGNTMKVVSGTSKLKLQEWAVSIFNDRGIKINQLKESKAIKVEIEGYLLRYVDICERIEKNNDVSMFKALSQELQKLMMESDPPEDLMSRIDGVKIRTEHGMRVYEKKEKDIAQLKGIFEKSTEEHDYKILISVIKGCNNILLEDDEVDSFKITADQESIINNLLSKAHNFLQNNYMQFIKKVSCPNIAQLTAFEKWMKALRDDLKALHYETLANATHNRLMEVIDNVDKLKETQMAIETTNKFLSINKPTAYTGQEELIAWQDEGTRIVEYINNNKFVDNLRKKDLVRKLQERSADIKKYLDGITEAISQIIDDAYDLKNINGCLEVLSTIELLLSKKIREKDKIDIVEIGNILQNFINEVKDIDSELNLLMRKEKFILISEKYSDLETVDLSVVFKRYISDVNKKLEELDKSWTSKYLSLSKTDIKKWDNLKCSKWISDTENVPYYLTDKNLLIFKELYKAVIERRKVLKVETIVDIFNTLDVSEKKYCLETLNNFSKK